MLYFRSYRIFFALVCYNTHCLHELHTTYPHFSGEYTCGICVRIRRYLMQNSHGHDCAFFGQKDLISVDAIYCVVFGDVDPAFEIHFFTSNFLPQLGQKLQVG